MKIQQTGPLWFRSRRSAKGSCVERWGLLGGGQVTGAGHWGCDLKGVSPVQASPFTQLPGCHEFSTVASATNLCHAIAALEQAGLKPWHKRNLSSFQQWECCFCPTKWEVTKTWSLAWPSHFCSMASLVLLCMCAWGLLQPFGLPGHPACSSGYERWKKKKWRFSLSLCLPVSLSLSLPPLGAISHQGSLYSYIIYIYYIYILYIIVFLYLYELSLK